MIKILDKTLVTEMEHAVRTCIWRMRVGEGRNAPYVCGGACMICSVLVQEGKCETLRSLFAENGKQWIAEGRIKEEAEDEVEKEDAT